MPIVIKNKSAKPLRLAQGSVIASISPIFDADIQGVTEISHPVEKQRKAGDEEIAFDLK